MNSVKGKLYLIPTTLGDCPPEQVLPSEVFRVISGLKKFVVEDIRSARRFLSSAGLKGHIDGLEFHELNEHSTVSDVEALAPLFDDGADVGLLSEAGLPAVADPGADLVALCHRRGIRVVPLAGPSSLMLSLMASGLNGQSFAFRGYLPAKTEERRREIKLVEKESASMHRTEIFIETPYRNDSLFEDLLRTLSPSTRLCVAADITLPTETILTRTVAQWRSDKLIIGKRPCVFLILA